MYDVKVDGKIIARAETELECEIYKLSFRGLKNREIAARLNLPPESVTKLTEGGATR